MNWRRGFLRTWIAVSVAWFLVVALAFYEHTAASRRSAAAATECAKARVANPSLGNPFDCFPGGDMFADLIPAENRPRWMDDPIVGSRLGVRSWDSAAPRFASGQTRPFESSGSGFGLSFRVRVSTWVNVAQST